MRLKKIILSYFLILVFFTPIFIEGVHDAIFHDYSHDFEFGKENSISTKGLSICYIHGFKYFSFEKCNSAISLTNRLFKNFVYLPYLLSLNDNNSHNYFLLRAPPFTALQFKY